MEENQKTKTLFIVLVVLILSIISAFVFLTIKKPKNNPTANNTPSAPTNPVQKEEKPTPSPATESAPIVYEKEAANPEVKQSEVIGKFISFDEKKSKIMVEIEGAQKTFDCPNSDCSKLDYLSINAGEEIAKPAQMADLKPNSQVNVRFKEDNTVLFVLIRK